MSRSHVLRGVAGGFAQMCHGKKAPLARMAVGDWLFYYSPRTEMGGGDPLQAFTAVGLVVGADVTPFDMGGGFVPFRRAIRYEPSRDVPLAQLRNKLGFIRDNANWGWLARRGHFEIPLEDADTIRAAMQRRGASDDRSYGTLLGGVATVFE